MPAAITASSVTATETCDAGSSTARRAHRRSMDDGVGVHRRQLRRGDGHHRQCGERRRAATTASSATVRRDLRPRPRLPDGHPACARRWHRLYGRQLRRGTGDVCVVSMPDRPGLRRRRCSATAVETCVVLLVCQAGTPPVTGRRWSSAAPIDSCDDEVDEIPSSNAANDATCEQRLSSATEPT